MDLLVTRLIAGLDSGVFYALIALSLAVVVRGTGTFNFAQGELAMFSAFVSLTLTQAGLPLALAVVAAVVFSFAGCAGVQYLLIRPFAGRSEHAAILVTIGLFLAVNAGAGVLWDTDPHRFPSMFPEGADDFFAIGGARLYHSTLGGLLVLGLVFGALTLVLHRTPLGLSMRAVAANPESARLAGVRVPVVNMVTWGLGGVIGAFAGVLTAPHTQLSTQMMLEIFLYGLAAATVGGLDSPGGAVLAGLAVGVGSELVGGYVAFIGQSLQQAVVLVVIVVVLLVRPSGLFGTRRVERA